MMNAIRLVAASALLMSAGAVFSQQAAPVATVAAEPRNVVQLSAAGMVQVEQDMLTITLMVNKEAPTLAAAQTQLKQALDEALAQAKAGAQPGQMDVSTGMFSLYPRYGKDQKVLGWQGRAELRLEGRDFGRITGMAGTIQSMAARTSPILICRLGLLLLPSPPSSSPLPWPSPPCCAGSATARHCGLASMNALRDTHWPRSKCMRSVSPTWS